VGIFDILYVIAQPAIIGRWVEWTGRMGRTSTQARHIITLQRNTLFHENVQTISLVLEGLSTR